MAPASVRSTIANFSSNFFSHFRANKRAHGDTGGLRARALTALAAIAFAIAPLSALANLTILSVTVDPNPVTVPGGGTTVDITVEVELVDNDPNFNNADWNFTNITLQMAGESDIEIVCAEEPNFNNNVGTETYEFSNVAIPGGIAEGDWTVRVRVFDDFFFEPDNCSSTPDANDDEDSSTLLTVAGPALQLTKTGSGPFADYNAAGQTLNYNFAVENISASPVPGPIVINDDLTVNETCPDLTTIGNFDANLDPGEIVNCSASYITTAGDVTNGYVVNCATASGDGGAATSAEACSTQGYDLDIRYDLMLCIDGSGSISGTDFTLQLDGTHAGLDSALSPDFLDSSVRVTVIQYSDTVQIEVGPTIIDSQATLDAFGTDISNISQIDSSTNTGGCIEAAYLVSCPAAAIPGGTCPDDQTRRIIDLSTDGVANVDSCGAGSGPACALQRAQEAQAIGIDVGNAIGVGAVNQQNLEDGVWPQPAIVFTPDGACDQPNECPESGDEGFVVLVDDFSEYQPAIEAKLIAEISQGFLVFKDFSDNNAAAVDIAFECGGNGTITVIDGQASEGDPAEFQVNGYTAPISCTATEVNATLPPGYTKDETDCANVDIEADPDCTIVNTLNSGNFTVTKDFSDDSLASVSVNAVCTSGTVTNNPQSASEASPAVFIVEGFTPGATCTATEVVPAGYTADQTDCADGDPIDGSCQIVNTLNTGNFTVTKDFSDDSVASVSVTAVCSSGTVTNNPQNASEASPAVFNVEGFTPGATCTATETVPPGYTADQTDCADNDPINGSCEIVNTLNAGSFTVIKDFSDDSVASVSVTAVCSSGTVTNNPQSASEASPAVFNVEGFAPGTTCTATESVPAGYTADQTDCADNDPINGSCQIVNTLNTGNFTVTKDFSDDSVASVTVNAVCTSGTVTNNPQSASEASPAVFTVEGFTPGATCTATEVVPAGYTADQTDCADGDPIDGSCGIVNTLNTGNFTVTKDFSDDSVASVVVNAVCTSGTVTNNPQNASEASPAVFTVEGFTAGATCTATETVPTGYTADQTDCADGDPIDGSCQIVNTLNAGNFTVTKDFSDDSLASVTVNAVCTSGTVTNNPQSASEASPAVFTVEGFTAGATCTATETVPAGYTADQTDCADGDPIDGSCEIVNTLNAGSFTVTKDFSDDSLASVSVTATCSSGTVTNNPQSASEASPAVFSVEGFAPGTTCTATETVPAGYTADQTDCADGDPIDGSCEIVNTLNTGNFTVTKDFSDDNVASVSVTAACTSGTVTNNPQNASEASPAVFTVEGFTPGATCTATEVVPAGYTADQTDCADGDPIDGSCGIVNTLNTGNFTVTKDFSDDSVASVVVNAVCTSGTVTNNPQNASEASPAVFTVEGFTAGATCTATETVPTGYTADQTDCADGDPIDGSCEIVNTLNSAAFTVAKTYDDGNTTPVDVGLVCDSGTVTVNVGQATPGGPNAQFTVEGFTSPVLCTATESNVPAGYTTDNSACVNVNAENPGTCTITNTLNTTPFTVAKTYDDGNTTPVDVGLVCDSGTVVVDVGQATPGGPDAQFTVEGFTAPVLCTATESNVPAGYTTDNTACINVNAETPGSCTITNTLNTTPFTVAKTYDDGNTTPVDVGLVCDSGTVVVDVGQATPGGPNAQFTVEGFTSPVLCTATESNVPAGYTTDNSACVNVDAENPGTCTIANTLNTTPFTVAKTYDDGNTTPVDVGLVCDSGTVVVDVGQATPGGPDAQFTVEGFTAPVLCTATESNVPAGYTTDNTACINVNAETPGSCTITNTLNSADFTVAKTYDDGNTTPVDIGLVCDSGTVTVNVGQATPGGPDAQFTVEGFTAPVLCTATESNVPAGYTTDNSACVDVNAENPGSCTITNTLNTLPFTVAKTYNDGNTTPVDIGLVCDSGTVTVNVGQATPGGPDAQFTVEGFTAPVLCTATESNVPAGYTTDNSACVNVNAEDPGSCTITNTVNRTDFTVAKTYDDGNTTAVDIALVCDSGTVTPVTPQATPGGPDAQFTVEAFTSPVLCTATESNVPAGYTTDNSACVDVDAEDPGACTITNTLNTTTFTVAKTYDDGNTTAVDIGLVCDSGTVTVDVGQATPGGPDAQFTVEGYTSPVLCTATESNVPAGYTTDNSACVDVDAENPGSCTITNTLNEATFTVIKDFTDDAADVVEITLVCSSGAPETSPLNASEGNPALFNVQGYSAGATCTATESNVPVGYATDNSDCVDVDVEADGECTITNIPNAPDISLDKTGSLDLGGNGRADPGDLITYSFEVDNTGNVVLDPVVVTDPLPGMSAINCDGDASFGPLAPNDPPVVCTATYPLTQNDIDSGFVYNLATATGTADIVPPPGTEGTQDVQDQDDHFEPIGQVGGLNIDKSADPDSYTLVGDQITYTFTVENTGNVTLFNVEVSDPLITDPPNSGTISCAGEANPIVDMAPGEVVVCTGVYTVTQADIDNGQVVNAATVTGECPLIDDGGAEGTVGGQENCPPSDEDDEIVEHEPGATTFRVQKDFSDDNPMNVMVSITCNTGLPLYQEAELSEFGNPFDFIEFIVGDFLPGTMDCSIEELIPAGYEPTYTAGATTGVAGSIFSDDDGCHYEEIEGGQFTCDIYNELLPVEVVVEKEWIDENPGYQLPTQVEVTLYCSEPIQGGFPCLLGGNADQASGAQYCSEQYIDPNNPGVWTVFPHYEGTDCWATEEPIAGVITDESDCEELTLFPGQGDSCLIVNTRIYAGIPTLSQYGLMLMALLMLGFGAVAYRRFV